MPVAHPVAEGFSQAAQGVGVGVDVVDDEDAVSVEPPGGADEVRHSINRVNGFSVEYGAGTFEDVDICFKSRQQGQRVWVNCDAIGYHYVGATQEKKRIGYPLQQNRMIFQTKWGESGLMAWSEWEWY